MHMMQIRPQRDASSLLFRIYLVFSLCEECSLIETGKASSPIDGSKHKKPTMFIWKTAMSDGHAKTLQSPKRTNCFTSCVDERAIRNMRLGPSRKSFVCV